MLVNEGRQARIDQCLASDTPTAGYLDYLLDQRVLGLKRLGALQKLESGGYLQEFEAFNRTSNAPLWYVHFHYKHATPGFADFVKAHVKRADQRHLGLRWQQAQGPNAAPIWRGDLGLELARKHFEALFS
ncbi:hypothetical protein [Pseudomonas sp. R5(2019)]|uniref:hypothetical protein n=1 Tax=Pseudomonas sp. R5(2019) TaxID=2697566 RepID=UPI001412CE4D|nr:hypothetical protein [Pseudomonas sp. R5(2019)]NBA94556.1 hypothetical protein [Pseudomonas sp. R5(2019)]